MSREITRVGVVGLGTMGAGIAEVFARSGYDVVGLDANDAAVDRGREHVEGSTERAVRRGKLTEDDLAAKVAEIDARDGVADGRITKQPRTCPGCGHTVYPRHKKCLYCGADLPTDSVFKTI